MVGSNRIVTAHSITNPVGNPTLGLEEEKAFRRCLVDKAIEALATELTEPKIFTLYQD